MWSHSFQCESMRSWRRARDPSLSRKRSRNGLKSSYSITNTRASGCVSLYSAMWRAICSRMAVLPAPFSPNTIEVEGSAGLPNTLSQVGW